MLLQGNVLNPLRNKRSYGVERDLRVYQERSWLSYIFPPLEESNARGKEKRKWGSFLFNSTQWEDSLIMRFGVAVQKINTESER